VLERARVRPMAILIAQKTDARGQGDKIEAPPMGATDCARPMVWARRNKRSRDAFTGVGQEGRKRVARSSTPPRLSDHIFSVNAMTP
jgi:hypothetical protein